ncbi:transaldolase [Candidatus Dojkabacteria bacterium]|uniref:Transaldolase n=1 Tax=Candidatus Dojkabacteria bacterium TaxID=2099670 RepID=A0A955RMC9_9BACT|nr:transaldolase [Candidatus Dojkabacteria bacterium]
MVYSARPENLKSGIFLDSGDPLETKLVLDELGFLDGQTTNPSLVAKNPDIAAKIERGEKLTTEKLLSEYKKIVQKIAEMIPDRSVSIEVYADESTEAQVMIEQGKEMYTWINSAHIKLPTTAEGLKAARVLTQEGYRVNMTLVFKQEQAASVHAATSGVQRGHVFVSPFLGRLDDQGIRGVDVVSNIMQMYKSQNSHVETLAASIRSLDHLLFLMYLHTDIITVPYKVLKKWIRIGAPVPERSDIDPASRHNDISYFFGDELAGIPYERIDMNQPFENFNIHHELTDTGLRKFSEDWNKLII